MDLFRDLRWASHRLAVIAGLMTLPYVWGKEAQDSMLSHLANYRVHVSLGQYLTTYGVYLDDLFYRAQWFTAGRAAALLLSMLAAALALRSRNLLFAWSFLIVTILPVAFIPPRAGFAFYLPMAGWSLYAASALSALPLRRTALWRKAALFGVVLVLLVRAHRIQALRMGGPSILGQPLVCALVSELDRQKVRFPQGARVRVIGDPFPQGEYGMLLLLRVYANDPTLETTAGGEYVLRWEGTRLTAVGGAGED